MSHPRQLDTPLYRLLHDEKISEFNKQKPQEGSINLRSADLRGLDLRVAERHGAGIGPPAGTSEHDRLGHGLGASESLLQVTEFRVVIRHVTENRFCLVELALTLKIKRQVVEILHHSIIKRTLAELVERHVKLTLPLKG